MQRQGVGSFKYHVGISSLAQVATRVGLEWTGAAGESLAATDQPGEGWSTNRITAEQPGRWRTRLSAAEQEIAIGWLSKFPIAADYPELG